MKDPTAVKRAKREDGGGEDVLRGLDEEMAQLKKAGNRVYYVFDMQVPGAIFIKISDWAKDHIDVKRVG